MTLHCLCKFPHGIQTGCLPCFHIKQLMRHRWQRRLTPGTGEVSYKAGRFPGSDLLLGAEAVATGCHRSRRTTYWCCHRLPGSIPRNQSCCGCRHSLHIWTVRISSPWHHSTIGWSLLGKGQSRLAQNTPLFAKCGGTQFSLRAAWHTKTTKTIFRSGSPKTDIWNSVDVETSIDFF